MKSANLAVRFGLEVAALAALAWWGWRTGGGAAAFLLAVAAPLAFAAVWAVFIAPKAARRLPDPARLVVEVVLFGITAAAVVVAGAPAVGLLFAVVVSLNLGLMVVWQQRGW